MLEGRELEGNIGNVGSYFVDVDSKGMVEVGVSAKVDPLAALAKLCKKTGTSLDDEGLKALMRLTGRSEEEVLAAFA